MCLRLLVFIIHSEIPTSDPRIAVCTKLGTVESCEEAGAAYEVSYVIDFADFLVPQRGFEPLTHALRMRCSTN
jgi:hypothetical protein